MDPNSIHLILKAEEQAHFLATNKVHQDPETPKGIKIKCKSCQAALGVMSNYGPNNAPMIAFKHDKVFWGPARPAKLSKWHTQRLQYQNVETRGPANFYGGVSAPPSTLREQGKARRAVPLLKPSPHDPVVDFLWERVAQSQKIPTCYQEIAFVEALLHDSIIALPTGSGKTFIASLILKRFHTLNPYRVAVLVVDRIPLVFQQKDSIYQDTGMNTIGICSQNKTRTELRKIADCVYDALVITAGCFFELFATKDFTMDMFSVLIFDECHHAMGDGHVYSKILDLLQCFKAQSRPRVVGLSASPFSCKDFSIAHKAMKDLGNKFYGALYCRPLDGLRERASEATEWCEVDISSAQKKFSDVVIASLLLLADGLQKSYPDIALESCQIRNQKWGILQGQLRQATYLLPPLRQDQGNVNKSIKKAKDCINEMHSLVAALEVCDLIGVTAAVLFIQNHSNDVSLTKKWEGSCLLDKARSGRFAVLFRILSKYVRILVVYRRYLCLRIVFLCTIIYLPSI